MPKPIGEQPKSTKPNGKTTAKKTAAEQASMRSIIYPEIRILCKTGEDALTATEAKQILGWESENDYAAKVKQANPDASEETLGSAIKFGGDFFLKDLFGEKIRLHNNLHNRDFRLNRALQYTQDILNRDWADSRNGEEVTLTYGGKEPYTMEDGTILKKGDTFTTSNRTINGETFSIGRTGLTLSAQHRMIALIFAKQIWDGAKVNGGDQSLIWKDKWPTEPTMECAIFQGIDESHATTRTLDNVLPRTLTDIIQTSPLFASLKAEKRAEASMILAHAVRMLWNRVGMGDTKINAFCPHQTNSEMLNFITLHPRLVDCARHILEENSPKKVKRENAKGEVVEVSIRGLAQYMTPGYAAALLYLMSTSDSDGDTYRDRDNQSETCLNWDNWERACEFWSELAKRPYSRKLGAINLARRPTEGQSKTDTQEGKHLGYVFTDPDSEGIGGSSAERMAVLAKAWAVFKKSRNPKEEHLKLEYEYDYNDDGSLSSISLQTKADFGGIDYLQDEEESEREKPTSNTENDETEETPNLENPKQRTAKNLNNRVEEILNGGSHKPTRAPGEVAPPPKQEFGPDGKPPVTRVAIPTTRKEIMEEQTRKAVEADAAKVQEEAAQSTTEVAVADPTTTDKVSKPSKRTTRKK